MPTLSSVLRAGAAGVAVGLSLAGPHAVGIAAADAPDTGSATSSAGPVSPGAGSGTITPARRSAVIRSGRGARTVAPAAHSAIRTGSTTSRQPSRPASAVGPHVTVDRIVTPADTGIVAVPAVDTAQPRTAVREPIAAATTAATLGGSSPLESVGFTVERFMDSVGIWLSGFPPNPITDFLTETLWLVRRTFFPVGPSVGLWGSATCVATMDCSGQDLRGVDLNRQDLTGVNFSHANLTGAMLFNVNLTGDDLTSATLSKANLYQAILTDANLSGAVVEGTRLARANLTNANLTNTDLYVAMMNFSNLTGANLTGADLQGASLVGAVWSNTTCPDGSTTNTGCSALRAAPLSATGHTALPVGSPPGTPSAQRAQRDL